MKRILALSLLIFVAMVSSNVQADLMSYTSSVLWREAVDVTISGSYAYCAAHSGLMVVNIVNRAAPQWVSQYYTQGTPTGIASSGFFVYMTCNEEGLNIFANTNPENIQFIQNVNTPGYAKAVFVSGDYAYVADGSSGLAIIDISVPSSARIISSYATIADAGDVYVDNGYAYVTSNFGSVHIIDVSDPEHPAEVCEYTMPHSASKICVSGNYAYVATGTYNLGFFILDVTNPASPALADSIATTGFATDISVGGNYAYLCDGQKLTIVNVTNKTNIFAVSYISVSGWAQNAFFDGLHYVYLANTLGLNICQVTDPLVPTNIGNYAMPNYATIHDSYVSGDNLFIANGSEGMWIYDIISPEEPGVIANYSSSSSILDLTVASGLAYLCGEDAPKLQIMDVSSPFNATVLGTFDTTWSARDIKISGNYAYLAGAHPGVQVIDISDPALPVSVGSFSIEAAVQDIQLAGNYAYVAGYGNGLYILNISDPTSPTLVSNYDTDRAVAVAVDGIFVYVGDSFGGLRILSVFDRANPVEIVHLTDMETVNDVYLYGQYLFVGAADNGIWLYDITNPAAPELVEVFETPGNVMGVRAVNSQVFVSDVYSMTILDFASSDIRDDQQNLPQSYLAAYGYPNPFNASTRISYEIGKKSNVTVSVYDMLGRQVDQLYSGITEPGKHSITWNPQGLGTGVYFCKIKSDESQSIQKLTLLK